MFGDKKKILGKSYLLVLLSIGYWPAEETDSLWKALFPVNTSGAGSSDRSAEHPWLGGGSCGISEVPALSRGTGGRKRGCPGVARSGLISPRLSIHLLVARPNGLL